MTNKFYFFRDGNQSSIAPDQSTRCHRLVSLSLVSRQSVLPILLLFLMLIFGVSNAWGAEGATHDFAQSISAGLNNNASINSVSISSHSYPVKEVKVAYSYNNKLKGDIVTINVSVGETSFGSFKIVSSSTSGKTSGTQSFKTSPQTSVSGTVSVSFVNHTGTGTGHGTLTVSNVQLIEGATAGPSYTVTATRNDNAYGTVSVSGTTITATPADCYQVASGASGYTVTSGTATVSHTGNSNTLAVTPSSDCTVQVNFEKKTVNTYVDEIQGYDDIEACGTHDAPSLDSKTPATSGTCAQQHWHFMGWVTEANKATPTDLNIIAPGTEMTAEGKTYYAVWAKGTQGSGFDGTHGGTFKIYADVSGTKYYATSTISGGKFGRTTDASSAAEFTIEAVSGGFTIKLGSNYVYYSGSTNLGTQSSSYTWTFASGTKGTWRTNSGTSGRGFIYRDGYGFGGYSTGNVTSGGSEYFDLEIGGGYEYSDYKTVCCTELGTINGSFNEANQTGGVLKWKQLSDKVDSWTVTYREGNTGNFSAVSTSATGTEVIETVTYNKYTINNLQAGKTYQFKITPTLKSGICTPLESDLIVEGSTQAAYTITAGSNNTDYGTVSLSGTTITATLADYCRYATAGAYTVTEGTATVSQNGNEFTVTPSSDCTVQINFEPIPVTGVTMSSNAETLEYNGSVTLTATVNPNTVNPNVTWTSSDPTVATVSNGTVTATQKAGTTTITATSVGDNTKSATCTVTVVPVTYYKKVTAELTDWSGEYLLVYEKAEDKAWVWKGTDATNCYAETTPNNGKITKPANGVKLTVASMEGGYSILINGGDNKGKYLGAFSSASFAFSDSEVAATISYDEDNHSTQIASGEKYVRFNNTSGQDRFRGYGETGQQPVQLYRKVVSSAVTITAPAEGTGTLALADGQTAVASGDNIEAGTQLTVTATPNGDNHYIGGTVTVTKTVGGNDVTSQVYNSTTGKITVPEYAITVSATFTPTYAVTGASVVGGSFSWEETTGHTTPTYAAAGTQIQASANATAGYVFGGTFDIYQTGASSTKVEHVDGLFEMPAYAVTIGGTFNQAPTITLSQTSTMEFAKVATEASTSQTFTVSAANLNVASLSVAISGANTDKFTLSVNSITLTDGAVNNAEVTVTPVTSVAGDYTATITVDDGNDGAAAQSFNVTLHVEDQYTINWYVNGTEAGNRVKSQEAFANDDLDIPNADDLAPFTDCSEFIFLGWKDGSAIDGGSSTSAPTLANVGTKVAASKNYYAVFGDGSPEVDESDSWNLETASDDWTGVNTVEYFSKPYGIKKANAYIVNSSISDFETYANNADQIDISVTCLQNGSTSGRLTIYLVDENGDIITGTGKEITPANATQLSGLEEREVTYAANEVKDKDATGYMVKCTTFDKNILISATGYEITKAESYSKYYTTCPQIKNVVLSAATVDHGSISFKVGGKAATNARTEEGDVVVDIVAVPETGYELTGISLSPLSGASYNTSTGKIELAQNTNGTLTVTATFEETDYTVTLNHTEGVEPEMTGATNEAHYGATINLTTTVPDNALFVNWTSSDVTITNPTSATEASFTMPAKNVTVTANFIVVHNVAWAIANTPAEGTSDFVYVKGIISSMGSETEGIQITDKYNNATYYISDLDENGNPINSYEVYRGKNVGNTDFATVDDLKVGDKVIVYGQLKTFSSVKEFDAGNYIITDGRTAASLSSVVISAPDASQVKTEYFTGETFLYAGLNARAVYNTGYQKDVTAASTFKANGSASLTVTANATVNVTATWSETTSAEYPVTISVTTKVLQLELTLSESALTGYLGQALPKPTTITAHFVDNEVPSTENVTLQAVIDENDVYNASSTAEQTIPVKYTFGPNTATASYTVTLSSIVNNLNSAYSVEKAQEIIDIDRADGNDLDLEVEGNKVYVTGVVTSISGSGPYTIQIKDNAADEAFLELYKCTFNGVTSVEVGDVVKAYGNLKWFANLSKYELDEGCEVVAVVRTPNLTVADVAEMEINITADLGVDDLTIDKDGSNGDITFSCSDAAVTIVNNKLHAAAAGDATVTATIAANGIYTSAETTFNVHVIAERTRYAITMDKNGGSGTDPEYANQLEGATVDLPADNTYSKANSAFAGWVVNDGAVEITDGHFTMPATVVTIKATWNDVETCAISFMVSGSEVATVDAPQTVAYSLASVEHPTVPGFTWVGWSETEYDDETTTLPTTITSYTPALNQESKTLYGIYSQVVGGASNLHYVLDYADDVADKSIAYNTEVDVTATDGSEWVVSASKQTGMQINTGKVAYIKVPNCPANIIQIVLTCNSGAQKAVAFSETSNGDALVSSPYDGTSQTLDLSSESVTTGYIIPSAGNCQITHIDVEYSGNVTYYTSSPVTHYNVTYAKGEATNVTGLCEAQRKVAGEITLCDAPTCADKDFAKWSDGSSLYAAGASYTLSADVTFTATWTPKPKYTVTYTANGGVGTAPAVEEYMEGETVTVKNNTYFSKPGFDYDGWLIVYNNGVSDQEITPEDGKFPMVAYNVTIKAKWAEESKQKWALVTDVSDLKAGDKYVIAAAGSNVAMAGQNANNRAETAVVKRNEGAQLKGTSSMQVITLEGSAGAWEFNTGAGYLYAAGSGKSNNYLRTQETNDANGKWTITISEGVATITATGTNTNNQLKYNSGSSIFSCYSSGQAGVALYKEIPMTVINDNDKDQDDVPDGGDMTIKQDKTWTVNNDKEVGDLYMEDGAIIANSDGENSAKVTANDLYFKARHGKSNQIFDLSKITVESNLYYDFQLCDDDLDANYWYSISVPFDVDLNSGVFQADGTQMENRVDFEVWGYNTQKRATTQSNGWERVSDNMMHAGKAYLIGFNPGQPNIIRLKAAAGWKSHLFSGTEMSVTSTGSGDHDNWNGLANPSGRYIGVSKKTSVFNNNTHLWDSYDPAALSFNFVVGTAFFVQSADAITISNTDNHGQYRAPKREDGSECAYAVRITRDEATNFDNQIIVRASEEATGEYTQGHDMLTMNGTSSNTAAMLWTENYGGKRLAIEEAAWLNGTATYVLKMYAPKAGTYSISVAEAKANADLYLTKDGSIIWNLSMGAYPVDLNKGTTNGYGLLLQKKAPGAATGVDNIDASEAAQKVIIDDHVYILRNGQMYDVNGKVVK